MTATFERHPIDLSALVFGSTFLVVGLAALAQELGWIDLSSRTWVGVVILAVGVAGAMGILGAVIRGTMRRSAAEASIGAAQDAPIAGPTVVTAAAPTAPTPTAPAPAAASSPASDDTAEDAG